MLKAIHDNVILQKTSFSSNKTIIMPNIDNQIYVVLNIGSEVSTIKVGQMVVVKEAPKKIAINYDEYYICSVENIVAIWEEENE